eukprot:maker-scaffold_51-snap-gene-0.5-mRNA-1 protein AED:0.01 eAED:0.01 QI:409/1/1/1/1/1/3/412/470
MLKMPFSRSLLCRRFATSAAKAKESASAALPGYLSTYPETKVTTLDNGIRVATEHSPEKSATIGLWLSAGSRYETEETNGVAHFLEHMFFKGTPTRSQLTLESSIENLGAHLNAYTSREQTVYYAKSLPQDTLSMLDILGDIIQNPTLDSRAIDRERDVILREMQEVETQTEEVVFDRLHETAFQGHGLGRTILGPVENILSLTEDNLREYIKQHYTSERLVIAAAGNVDHDAIVDKANEVFKNLPAGTPGALDDVQAYFVGSDVRIRNDEDPLAHIALAFESRGWTSPDSFAVMLLQTLLGCWDKSSVLGANSVSPLCSTVAEKELAESLMAFNTSYTDTGLFGVYAVARPMVVQDLVYYTLEALVGLGIDTTEEELVRAKAQLMTVMMSQLDGTSQVCEDIGRQMLTYGRRLTPAEVFQRVEMVTLDEVKKVAFDIVNDKDLAAASIGPVHEMPDYNWLRRRTYWQRM